MKRDRREWWLFLAIMVGSAIIGGMIGLAMKPRQPPPVEYQWGDDR